VILSDNLYEILGTSPEASPDAIERAWKAQLRRWHPDCAPDKGWIVEATRQAALINAAHDVLADPVERAAYDRCHSTQRGAQPVAAAAPADAPWATVWARAQPTRGAGSRVRFSGPRPTHLPKADKRATGISKLWRAESSR
jgi:curved DNA-binding protein CbpA